MIPAPIIARELPKWFEPAGRFAAWEGKPYRIWLDTACGTGWSILAANPLMIFRAKGRRISIRTPDHEKTLEGDPFTLLNEELARRTGGDSGGFPLGAAIGYFGYDLKNFVEKLPEQSNDDLGLPDAWFGFYDDLLIFDHRQKKVYEVTSGRSKPVWEVVPPTVSDAPVERSSNFTREEYEAAVRRAQEYIAAGDIYQVNLSQRFQCSAEGPALELYQALREASPAAYCGYLDIGEAQILSSSPECFLQMQDRRVITRPIKGTRRRAKTAEEDGRVIEELRHSPKDNAELVMITDLERNDLGRVCEYGSVKVNELVRVESYATVHHLVATIEGKLRTGVGHVDGVRACFPGGSITGAPKIRAMEIIGELEPQARGVYTGAIGYLGYNNVSHLNIAIRTIVRQGKRLTFHAGGGIVADSEPAAEYEETLAKAQGIFNALDQLRLRQRTLPA